MGPTLLIRADATPHMGSGHLMRCLAMAETWMHAGGRAVLASAGSLAAMQTRLQSIGVEPVALPAAPGSPMDAAHLAALARERQAAWVMVDGYQFDAAYQDALKSAGCCLLFVDDFGHAGRYSADLVLNQNLGARSDLYQAKAPHTRLLLGPRFVLLRRQFVEWRRAPHASAPASPRVLVTLGGSDPHNVTARVLRALEGLAPRVGVEVTAVLGDSNPQAAALEACARTTGFRLCRNILNMAELMAEADLAIAAGGTTAWELAYMGVPALLLAVAENQVSNCRDLDAAGVARYLGWHAEVSSGQIGGAIAASIGAADERAEMSRRGRALIDGRGCARAWFHLNEERLRLRPASAEDARLLWEWANSPEVRAVSFSTEPIPWDGHVAWFEAKRRDPLCRLWVAEETVGRPIGQVRFDLHEDEAVISVSLDAAARGRNLGSLLIWKACRELFASLSVPRIVALIKPGNAPSVQAFLKAGFDQVGQRAERGEAALVFELSRGRLEP